MHKKSIPFYGLFVPPGETKGMDFFMDYEEMLTIKAAWYYYMENITQQKISELLGISRIRVIKLLEKARQNGVVQFSIHKDGASRMTVEKKLLDTYPLKDVFVVPSIPKQRQEQLNESIAQAAVMYINDRLGTNRFINVGYGDTSSRILNHLATMPEAPVSCVSLTGGVNYYLPNTQSSIFNAKLHLIPAPLIVASKEMVTAMRQENSIQEISRMVSLAAFTVIGIGAMSEDATIIKSGIMTTNDLMYLKARGAVGDILSHFIDQDGNLVPSGMEDRLISTPLSTIQELDNVIGVAAGAKKIPAIRAVLRKNYLEVLITDEDTANQLLEHETA